MTERTKKLENFLKLLYDKHKAELLFHGWHHIKFVAEKSKEFADDINANKEIVYAAALVHDLNYVVAPNSKPETGESLRNKQLAMAGFSKQEIDYIEKIIMEAHTAYRNEKISIEAQALSDADTLFRSLPITPVLFASRYIAQNKVDIGELADKVTSEQNPLMEKGTYFYTNLAKKKYLKWAKTNLELWNYIKESLNDPEVSDLIKTANENH